MKLPACALGACALAFLASTVRAQIVVPTDFPTLDLAIAAASPGDIILVRTGATQPPITIDKPLTIIGEPIVSIEFPCGPGAGPIELAGPGSGKVELINFSVSRGFDCFSPPPGILGGGYTDLVLQNCNIPAPAVGLTGLGEGAPGISVNVTNLVVQSCLIAGRGSDSDHCAGFLFTPRHAGISAPGATVLLLDSTVQGGNGGLLCCQRPVNCSGCPSLAGRGGEGGDGVVCESLFVANSTINAGIGSEFYFEDLIAGTRTLCGKQPDGERFVVNLYANLGNELTLNGPLHIGQNYQLSWNTAGPATSLFLGFGFSFPPSYFPGSGWAFGDASTFRLATFFGGGPVVLNLPVPPNPGLLGMDVHFQLLDSTDGISRPVTAIIEN